MSTLCTVSDALEIILGCEETVARLCDPSELCLCTMLPLFCASCTSTVLADTPFLALVAATLASDYAEQR